MKSLKGMIVAVLCCHSALAVDVSTKEEFAAALAGTEPISITADMVLSGWETVDRPSGVSIDGGNHTISGLTVPMLGAVTGDATIKNLVFSGAAVSATSGDIAVCAKSLKAGTIHVDNLSFVGCTVYKKNSGSAGFVTGSLETPTTALVENCTFDVDCELTAAAGCSAAPVAASLVANGDGAEATVSKCVYRGKIVLKDWTMKVAGIVCGATAKQKKYTHMAYVNIYDCVNYADISFTGPNGNAGGIVNSTEGGTESTDGAIRIARCVNYGNINLKAAQNPVGGIVSSHKNGAIEITDCLNYGNVTALNSQPVGGIVGALRSLIKASAAISGCANLGALEGNDAGGIVGEHNRQGNSKNFVLRSCLNRGTLTARREGSSAGELLGYISAASTYPLIELSGSVGQSEKWLGGMIAGTVITALITSDNLAAETAEGLVDGTALAALNACNDNCNLWKQGTLTPILKIMPDEPAPDTMTIVFKDSSAFADEVLKTCVITRGTTPVAPAAPEHDGYTFLGWSVEDLTGLSADTEIVAVYESGTIEHTVRFLDWNGELLGEPQTVVHGKAAEAPAAPSREDWLFTGWDVSFAEVMDDLDVTACYVKLVQEIATAEDLSAALAQATHPELTYRLTDDLVLPADWRDADFVATLDGEGHTISYAGKRPLFFRVTGTVRNLTLDGGVEVVVDEESGESELRPTTIPNINEDFGLVAVQCLGGTIANVTVKNYVLQMLNAASGKTCGFVCARAGDGARVEGCSVETSCRFDTRSTAIGGIVGASMMSDSWTGADPRLLTVDSCTNRADLVTFSSGGARLAGIVADCSSASETRRPDIVVTNCVNYGSMRKGNVNVEGYFAGIVACRSENINNGILAGTLTIADCANYGDIDTQGPGYREDTKAHCAIYGGIFAYTYRLGAITIARCQNRGKVGDLTTPTGGELTGGFSGGIVGYACDVYAGRPVRIVDCANYGPVNGGLGVGGLFGSVTFNYDYNNVIATATNCANDGALAVAMEEGSTGEWCGHFPGTSRNPNGVTFGAWNCLFATSSVAGNVQESAPVHVEGCFFADAEGFTPGAARKALTAYAVENELTPWIRTRTGIELAIFGESYESGLVITVR